MTPPRPHAWLRTAINLFGHRRRRTWSEGSRAHIELRALDPAQFARFAAAVDATFAGLGGISGVHLNGLVGRAIIEFDASLWSAEKLATIVDAIELRLQLRELPFAEALPDYPADIEPLLRKAVNLGADVVGVILGTGLRIAGFTAGRAGFDLAAVMTVMDNTPRLRQLIVDRLGTAGAEVGVGVTNALVQAVGAGPIGPLVDMLVQAIRLRGERARRAAWIRREAELCAATDRGHVEPLPGRSRPTPLPESIVERYSNDALFASLGGFVVGIADTHNLESALAPLFSGLPKAALYGRTIFAAELMVTLGRRGALVLRSSALRLLDRVDTVVIEAEVLFSDAQVPLRPALRRDAEALLASVRRSRLHFVLAADDPALARLLSAHDCVPAAGLAEAVEDLQRHGRVVAVIASRSLPALARADVGIGLVLDRGRPPWSADIMLGEALRDALFLVDACAVAREVAGQSVVLAGVGAALGAALALGGLRKTKPQQVMLATHAASVIALANGLRRAADLSRRPAPKTADPTPWHRLDSQAVLERLDSAADVGLSAAVAAERRHRPPPAPSRPLRFARAVGQELINPLTPVLVTGAALSAVTGSLLDAGLIAAVFGLNAAIGGVERYQAEAAITAIERRERHCARVLRSGRWDMLDAEGLVVGDIVDLEAGEVVPADCRLLAAEGLEVDESSLTGESLPVAKDPSPSYATVIAERSSMLYEGTAIAVGRARAVIVATGADTEARRGMYALPEISPETGVEARLRKITEMTLPIAGLSGALLVGAGLFRHQDIHGLIDLGVSMTIAAVPEGLPLLATVAQLAASRRLSRRGALVRNPRTVEALGRLDVLCADKTGTLTEGKIRLHGLAEDGHDARVDDGELSPSLREILADRAPQPRPANLLGAPEAEATRPTALVVDGGARRGDAPRPSSDLPPDGASTSCPSSRRRGYHAVARRAGRRRRPACLAVKGAPEALLPRCVRWRTPDGHRPRRWTMASPGPSWRSAERRYGSRGLPRAGGGGAALRGGRGARRTRPCIGRLMLPRLPQPSATPPRATAAAAIGPAAAPASPWS
jgi:cation-transporting ATPase I